MDYQKVTIYLLYLSIQMKNEQEEVKLIKGIAFDGGSKSFFIFINSNLGKGSFGVVKKAIQVINPNKHLAVKIIPFGGDPVKKEKIEQEINILRLLPDHQNLVRVLPYKCFSEKNFYIFMELCPDGELTNLVFKGGQLPEETIISIFYQLLSGYRVLWEADIVHQDLKLGNVLMKKGMLKITDFGFSILLDKYQKSLTRVGTLTYMPFQKLTSKEYQADSSSDVYSMGVMMFLVLTKRHPYIDINKQYTPEEYVRALKTNKIRRPTLLSYSLQIHKLLDVVIKMCQKTKEKRITCKELYDYLDSDEIFASFREKRVDPSDQIKLPSHQLKIEATSQSVFVPLNFSPEDEEEYIKTKKTIIQGEVSEEVSKVQNWVLGARILLYFFDRLSTKLMVEAAKEEMVGQIYSNYNRTILSCLSFEKRLVEQILKEIAKPNHFTSRQNYQFRVSPQGRLCEQILMKDKKQIRENTRQYLSETSEVDRRKNEELIEFYNNSDMTIFVKTMQSNILNCIKIRSASVSNRSHLITLVYLFDAIQQIDKYPQVSGFSLEGYFQSTETKNVADLVDKVISNFQSANLELPVFTLKEEDEENNWI